MKNKTSWQQAHGLYHVTMISRFKKKALTQRAKLYLRCCVTLSKVALDGCLPTSGKISLEKRKGVTINAERSKRGFYSHCVYQGQSENNGGVVCLERSIDVCHVRNTKEQVNLETALECSLLNWNQTTIIKKNGFLLFVEKERKK